MAKRKRTRYTDEFRASAVLMLEAAGYPTQEGALSRVARQLQVPAMTLSRWFKGTNNPPPNNLVNEKRIDLVQALRNEANAAVTEMAQARENASYRDLGTVLGILIDKLQLLDGKPTERIETVQTWLDELPANEYQDVIAEAERIIRASGGADS